MDGFVDGQFEAADSQSKKQSKNEYILLSLQNVGHGIRIDCVDSLVNGLDVE